MAGLQGCISNKKDDSTNNADSMNVQKATPDSVNIVDLDDANFAINAANSNMAYIELGKLAVKNGLDKRIKNFGAMMVKDHSKSNAMVQKIAQLKRITLPTVISTDKLDSIATLTKKSGKIFDNAYITILIGCYEQDIKTFHNASENSIDPELKKFAAKTLPALKRQLETLTIIRGSIK